MGSGGGSSGGGAAMKSTDWPLYQKCLNMSSVGREFFTVYDTLLRLSLTILLFYYNAVTKPFSFYAYTFMFNHTWQGIVLACVLQFFYPIMPFFMCAIEVCKTIKSLFVTDWKSEGPGRVFFVRPNNPIAAVFWDCYLQMSQLSGTFVYAGASKEMCEHTWYDHKTTKDFWRDALTKGKARLPREMGTWEDEKLSVHYPMNCDIIIKITDSYLGIGDKKLNYGEDYKTVADIEKICQEEYVGKKALVLEMVRPKPSLGVHSIDLITMKTKRGVKILHALLWTDCTTWSSHSTRAGYVVDVETETIVSPANWYSPFFKTQKIPLVGTKLNGLKKAAEMAVASHEAIDLHWLTAVGWDCMIMEEGPVFFEGNFAAARTPRRIFHCFSNMMEFIRTDFGYNY